MLLESDIEDKAEKELGMQRARRPCSAKSLPLIRCAAENPHRSPPRPLYNNVLGVWSVSF
jgi:hypothetical protein